MNKILLVDDELSIIHAELRTLKKWLHLNSYEALSARNGQEALELLAQESKEIKIVISDQKMPGMSGAELLTRIKRDYPHIVSIIMTGYADMELAIKAIDAGVFSYLLKPVDNEQFLNEVKKAEQLVRLKRENRRYLERIRQELQWAAELQKTLLRVEPFENEKVNFEINYLPLKELGCGGDFYDIIPLPRNRYLILIGDVAGHGIKAAFITTIIKQMVRNEFFSRFSPMEVSPGSLLEWLNRRYHEEIAESLNILLTFSASLLDLERMELAYSNGGHMPTLLKRGGKIEELQSTDHGLGFMRNMSFTESRLKLEAGDLLFFFTDGLIERQGSSIKEKIGYLSHIIEETPVGPGINRHIIEEIDRLHNRAPFADDVTAISVLL